MRKNKKYKLYIQFNYDKCYWFEFEDKETLDEEFNKFKNIKADSIIIFGDTIVNFSNVLYMEKVE